MLTKSKDLRTGNPLWLSQPVPRILTSKLTKDQRTDIVIIGAGITGAMAAESLSAAGFKVILIDRRGPLKGATSASTALLQYEIDTPLTVLSGQIGRDKAMRAWRRSKLALESLHARITSLGLKCDVKPVCSLFLAGNVLDADGLKLEAKNRNEIGLYTDYLTRDMLKNDHDIRRIAALKAYDNLSVNPVKLAGGFLLKAIEHGAQVFAPVTAERVETHRDGADVITAEGPVIRARYVIYASGYEMPKDIRTRRHSLNSTYAIATRPQPDKLWPQKCLIWEASDPYLYMRCTADGRVICGGEDEEFEDEDKRDSMLTDKVARLEAKLKDMFPQLDTKADFAWCGSFGASTTGLPTIGAVPAKANVFAIMAYGGNGITFSRLGAELLTTTLTGGQDPEADLFGF
ncbi:NAD(P)/FAD-dependent oxidoreductase [Asticcacaulis endophyticus]|uniref:FAD-dependent oxidoreductase n=1 Tax=Asticcacaulis endophyticus TaxID=1395890 RepID=A0A918UV36_9CAUL|nr:FAD-dependent oxidoreductase [Asticcacaulis endophyticus]GGZ34921.1 FAD-dependent oxidoreductase [Asticcacaulis endophyticus]